MHCVILTVSMTGCSLGICYIELTTSPLRCGRTIQQSQPSLPPDTRCAASPLNQNSTELICVDELRSHAAASCGPYLAVTARCQPNQIDIHADIIAYPDNMKMGDVAGGEPLDNNERKR